ncbi:MAG: hypothetical protein FJ167_08805, partial [Gammaproteobacteria bacterium]|nr:hypothetical protein [Gammaproteobacteria bacterium]
MAIKKYITFQNQSTAKELQATETKPDDVKAIGKNFRVAALALGYQGTNYFYTGRSNFEPSPYDFDRIIQAVDTDSYVKQSVAKYKDLFWKEGWKIIGENQEAVSYLYQRIDYMEMAMKRPFLDFLIDLSDQLIKFSNVFAVKARGDLSEYFPTTLTPVSSTQPVVGYYLIPTEQVRILRDKYNRPKSYQQATDPLTYSPTDRDPVWLADRVIHLFFDRKPGRAFGTPFLSNALDDIVALRQMEEDIQNLVHRELFPLYKYIIGTADQPAEPDEIDKAATEIENLRTEGGLILPYRHDVEVIGSGQEALDANNYLEHFKERVAIGLGVAPHHLGMTMNGGNRSMSERLDTSLYDRIKQFQKQFAEMIRLHIFNELLFEGGFDPIKNPFETDISDRCYFKFNEIDVDTQVKKETHVIQKYVNSVITLTEARIELGIDPEVDQEDLFSGIQNAMQKDLIDTQQSAQDATSDKQTPA